MVKINTDTNATKPTDSFEPLPNGWYPLALASADYKERPGEALDRINYVFDVVDGPYKGRKLFGGWNVPGKSQRGLTEGQQKAVEISDRHLASLVVAVKGDGSVCGDTDELVGKVVSGKIKIRPGSNGYEASNDIVMFVKLGEENKAKAAQPGNAGGAAKKPSGPAWAAQK